MMDSLQETTNEYSAIQIVGSEIKAKSPIKMPSKCMNCGTKENLVSVKTTLNYVNPLVFLWLLLTPFALAIAYIATKKECRVSFERCTTCNSKKERWQKIAKYSWIGFGISILLRILFDGIVGYIFAGLIFTLLIFSLFASAMKDVGFTVRTFKKPYFFIKGINSGVLQSIVKG